MTENLITWNVTNWVTVVVMAALGYAVLTFGAQLFHVAKARSGGSQS